MPNQQSTRDRAIHRKIHALYWRSFWESKWTLITTYVTRLPAYVIQHALIPLTIAYGLQAIIEHRFNDVPGLVMLILGLSLTHVVLLSIAVVAVSKNAAVGAAYVQNQVFTNYLNKDYEFYSNSFMGALSANATRLREASTEYGLLMTLDIPKQIVTVIAGLVVIGWQAPMLSVITLVCMGVLVSFTIIASKIRLKYRRQLSHASSELAGALGDAIGQAQMVKSFAAEQHEQQALQAPISAWQRIQKIVWLTSIPADFGRYMFMAVTIGILLLTTANLYQHGAISIAIVALVQLYVIKMINTTSDIADLIKRYETIVGSVYHAMQVMQVPATIQDAAHPKKLPSQASKLTVQLTNVGFWYNKNAKDRPAVKNFDLTIAPGEKIGVVGYSGSGKTTLTKLLMRFMDVTEGSIAIAGVDLRDVRQQDIRKHICLRSAGAVAVSPLHLR